MAQTGFALFATAIGACGIAWNAPRILRVLLPGASADQTRASLEARCPELSEAEPPASVQRTVKAIEALIRGEAVDFSEVELEFSGVPEFHRQVYEVARQIPAGATLTYGEVARRLGGVGVSRAVGQALGRNPWPIIVPCHRVLAASGKTGGFSAPGGIDTKLRLLTIEAGHAAGPPGLFPDLPLAARPRRRIGAAGTGAQ